MSNVQRPLFIFNLVCNCRKTYLPLPQLYGKTLMKELSSGFGGEFKMLGRRYLVLYIGLILGQRHSGLGQHH